MTPDERTSLFLRDLQVLVPEQDASVIFHLAQDENKFAQFSHAASGDALLCQVSNCAEGWDAQDVTPRQVADLKALGFSIPAEGHANPSREYRGDLRPAAADVELVFRRVFDMPEDYAVESSGVMW